MSAVEIIPGTGAPLVLEQAILLYRNKGHGEVYATVHPVHRDGTAPGASIIGPGTALTKGDLADFAKVAHKATSFTGFIPERLLYSSPNLIAWWVPAQIRRTWFKSADEAIGTASGDAAHPALVFLRSPNDWQVFALAHSQRPGPDTALLHAPHFNVYSGGSICVGNVKLPKALSADSIDALEDAFFRSHFTHPNHAAAVRGSMVSLWAEQLKTPNIDAMLDALLPAGVTLQQAIKRAANQ